MQEYQALKRTLRGEKPPARGRTWRRIAARVVPGVIRKPLEHACGGVVGDILGLLIMMMVPCLPLLMTTVVLDGMLPSLEEGMASGNPTAAFLAVAKGPIRAITTIVTGIWYVSIGIKVAFRGW